LTNTAEIGKASAIAAAMADREGGKVFEEFDRGWHEFPGLGLRLRLGSGASREGVLSRTLENRSHCLIPPSCCRLLDILRRPINFLDWYHL
jgi:hypothetical protein